MIQEAKNGCASVITFREKKVFYSWDSGISKSSLGTKLDKTEYLKANVNESNFNSVQKLMIDWELYENGWFINSYNNKHLFYYLTQIGNYGMHRPIELDYFK
jgi:hypothetical protein